jgi:hypothetical protein
MVTSDFGDGRPTGRGTDPSHDSGRLDNSILAPFGLPRTLPA